MPLFSVDEVIGVSKARVLSEPAGRRGPVKRICTDSRQIRPGDLFVALSGEQFDGHRFVAAALRGGAVGALVQDRARLGGRLPPGGWLLEVPDTLRAYQDLAAAHRERFRIPVVAVTGSNGKTTTKEMVARVLAQRWRTLKTEGNLNNRIGVAQTLLRLRATHEAAVIEMGVDARGQTTRLCEMARPTVGVVTNVGPDHLEFFGTLEESARAKRELVERLPADGALVLNADDPFFDLLAAGAPCPVTAFGLSERAQVRARDITHDPRRGMGCSLELPGRARRVRVALPAHGLHNLANALAAAAVGHVLDLGPQAIARGLARFRPVAMRSQIKTVNGVRIINDCYNANPASMTAAIDLLADLGRGRRTIAVLGDMLELGPETVGWHRAVGAHLARRGVAELVVAGPLGREIAAGARADGMRADRVREAEDAQGAAALIDRLAAPGDVVLVKASRGMKMETVIETLRRR